MSKIISSLLLLALAISSAYAAPVAAIDDNLEVLTLTPYLDYFADPGDNLTLDSAMHSEMRFRFEPVKQNRIELKPSTGAKWFRFSLHNYGIHTAAPLLEIYPIHFNKIEVFSVDSMQVIPAQRISSAVKKHILHQLAVPPNTTRSFYIRLENERSLLMGAQLLNARAAAEKHSNENFYTSIALAITFVTFIIFSISAIRFRDPLLVTIIAYLAVCLVSIYGTMRLGDPEIGGSSPKLQLGAMVTIAASLLIQVAWQCGCVPWLRLNKVKRPNLLFVSVGAVVGLLVLFLPGPSMLVYIPAITLLTFTLVNLSAIITWIKNPSSLVLAFTIANVFSASLIVSANFLVVSTVTDNYNIYNLLMAGCLFQIIIIGAAAIYEQLLRLRVAKRKTQHQQIKLAQSTAVNSALSKINQQLRTPLTGILGMTELLEHTQLTTMQQDYVETLTRCSNELIEAFESTASHVEHGHTAGSESRDTIFNINSKIDEVLVRFRNISANRSLELICDKESLLNHWVKDDPERLRLLFGLLLSNAFDKTQKGELILRINDKAPNGKIYCWLSQTSDQLTRAEIQAIENPNDYLNIDHSNAFSSLPQDIESGDTHSRYAMASRICQELRGKLTITRNEPGDVLLYFEMQFNFVESGQNHPSNKVLHGRKLLIVDRSTNFCNVTSKQTKNWGMEVFSAISESEALAHCRNNAAIQAPFDLILIEQTLPGKGGIAVAARIRHEMKLAAKAPPAVILSTIATTRHLNDGLPEAGIVTSVTKPISNTALRNAFIRAIENQNMFSSIPSAKKLECLIIAEQQTMAEVLIGMLQLLNVNYRVVNNASQGIESLRHDDFNIVLIDVARDTDLNTVTAISDQRNMPRNSDFSIITLLSNSHHLDTPILKMAGVDGSLIKPVNFGQLYNAIHMVIDENKPLATIDSA